MTKTVIRITFTIILILLSAVRAEPKTSNTIHMPLIARGRREVRMSNWKLIVPQAIENLVDNPSIALGTDGYTFDGTNVGARSTATSKWGLYSASVQYQDDLDLARFAITLTAEEHTFSAWVFLGAAWDGGVVRLAAENFAGSSITTATTSTSTVSTWVRLSISFSPVGGDLTGDLVIEAASAPTAGRGMFFDGVQCEAQSEATTYCDGDQDGCEWLGAAHASTSQRSAQSRAGGFVRDLRDDFGFAVARMIDVGAASQSLLRSEFETQPGGITSGVKITSRVFALTGTIYPTADLADLHAQRQALFSVLDPQAVPQTAEGPQPVILRYIGAAVVKDIAAHYEHGLGANIGAIDGEKNEKFTLRFLSDDPFWYGLGESAAELDNIDAVDTFRFLAARLRSTGQWSNLGLIADPTTGGTINTILHASDGSVYYGGVFTGFNGNVGWDYMVRYTPSTDTWSRIDGASEFNSFVLALAEAPDGTIFIGGGFTNAGDANGDYLAQYDPATNTVSSVLVGGTGAISTMAFDNNGLLYFGGNFAAWDGVNESANIATYNGTVYAAVGNGFNSLVEEIAIAPNNTVYAIGFFTADWDASNPFLRFASFDGTTWTQAGSGLNATSFGVDVASNGIVTLVGGYTDAGSVTTADYVSQWNDTAYTQMGTGADTDVQQVKIAPNDEVYAGGDANTFSGIATEIGRWNGSSWTNIDLLLPDQVGPPLEGALSAIDFGRPDPVIADNFDTYIGFNTTGVASIAGAVTVTNTGTAQAYPRLTILREGGTGASVISLRNERTGKEISFDYDLLDGETLTVDLDPRIKTAISSMFGSRQDAVIRGSDWGTWVLLPGAQIVTCFVTPGGATITAALIWEDTYKAND